MVAEIAEFFHGRRYNREHRVTTTKARANLKDRVQHVSDTLRGTQ